MMRRRGPQGGEEGGIDNEPCSREFCHTWNLNKKKNEKARS